LNEKGGQIDLVDGKEIMRDRNEKGAFFVDMRWKKGAEEGAVKEAGDADDDSEDRLKFLRKLKLAPFDALE